MDARAYIAERMALVDAELDRVLPASATEPTRLHSAMRHLVFPGGKRLRPAMAFAAAEACGAAPERALPMAVAVELIHTYSLIHDDLPCMDDDDERRGRPTVHVAFDEATAVLAGDALHASAFEALASAARVEGADPRRIAIALHDLARAIGASGLVGGQVDDLGFAASDLGTESREAAVLSIHHRKTAALIRVSVTGGARLAGAEPGAIERLARYGDAVGVAFQIADDVLDADEDEGCTLVPLLGAEGARKRADTLLDSALEQIDGLGERAEPLRALARFAVRREQ